MSGIIGSSTEEVQNALRQFAYKKGGTFEAKLGSPNDENILVMDALDDHVTVLYPGGFLDWDEASRWLSEHLSRPVFSFHIHDDDLWMFILFRKGEEITRFNPLPDYWSDDIAEEEINHWMGNAPAVASCISGLKVEKIERYFKRWDFDNDENVKAYPDDQFAYLDSWQLCDFMMRIPLSYPIADDGSCLRETFEFIVPEGN